MSTDGDDDEPQDDRTSPGEWALGVLGGLVAVSLLVFLGQQAIVRDDPAQLDVVVTEVRRTDGEFVVTLRVDNSGGATAEAVSVTGEVLSDGSAVDEGSATVPYVPADSHRSASLVFDVDPEAPGAELVVGVAGYTPM